MGDGSHPLRVKCIQLSILVRTILDPQYVNQLSYLSDWKNCSLDFPNHGHRVQPTLEITHHQLAVEVVHRKSDLGPSRERRGVKTQHNVEGEE
jgi:hypothetical protein